MEPFAEAGQLEKQGIFANESSTGVSVDVSA